MARLNEAAEAATTTAAEDGDLVRRRLARQNHELAKANSRLAMAVRAATADATKIEAANLELRGTVIRLQNELTASQRYTGMARVDQLKVDLQAKLQEMGTLIAAMSPDNTYQETFKSLASWAPREPQYRFAAQPFGLTIIDEDSVTAELQLPQDDSDIASGRLSDQSADSPALEPAPYLASTCLRSPEKSFSVHPDKADEGDNGNQDSSPAREINAETADLSVNLEVRRRRKDMSTRHGRSMSLPPFESVSDESTRVSKRNLSMSAEIDPSHNVREGEFKYSLRAPNLAELESVEIPPPATDTILDPLREDLPCQKRKVLGNKSVNMSPRKQIALDKSDTKAGSDDLVVSRLPSSHDEFEPKKKDRKRQPTNIARRPKSTPRDVGCSPKVIATATASATATVEEVTVAESAIPPVIDIRLDGPDEMEVASPYAASASSTVCCSPSPEPTWTQTGSKDTPPPSDHVLPDINSRPSRRARGAVSYAEPSLNTKLRRPTKGFVDAVYRKQQGGMSMEEDERTVVKREATDETTPATDSPLPDQPGRTLISRSKDDATKYRRSSIARRRSSAEQGQQDTPDLLSADADLGVSAAKTTGFQEAAQEQQLSTQSPSICQTTVAMKSRRHTSQTMSPRSAAPATLASPATRPAGRRSASSVLVKSPVSTTAFRRRSTVV